MNDVEKEILSVVKVGGAILENDTSFSDFLDRFVALPGQKILVHGGGRSATDLSKKLGIESKLVDGRRITDAETLDIVTMVYGGLINKKAVAALQARTCNACGLTGADLNLITASKRPINEFDFGYVGDIEQVNYEILALLLKRGVTPVIAPITHDGKGQLLNTNADTMASAIATAMAFLYKTTLVFCFEKPGVLVNPEDDTSVIHMLTPQHYQSLKADGAIHSGMIPKLDNSFIALQKGVNHVIITSASTLNLNSGTCLNL